MTGRIGWKLSRDLVMFFPSFSEGLSTTYSPMMMDYSHKSSHKWWGENGGRFAWMAVLSTRSTHSVTIFYKRNLNNHKYDNLLHFYVTKVILLGQANGSAGKVLVVRSWKPESGPQNLHKGWRRETTPQSCPRTSACASCAPRHVCLHAHRAHIH